VSRSIDGDAEHALLTSIMAQMVKADGQVVGAAFAVGPDLLVTSAHVVAGATRLVPLGASPVDFEVVATFAEVDDVMPKLAPWPDLAVLRIEDHRFSTWAALADSLPPLPAAVRMVGFPPAGGARGLAIDEARISSVGGATGAKVLRLTDVQVEGGASGGPLIDPGRRMIVGLVLASKDPKQRHGGFAVGTQALRPRWPAEAGPWPAPPPDEGPWERAYPGPMAASVPPAIVHLPKRGNAPHFVRRPALVERLARAGDEPTVIRALGGSGGVGKSELALYWARRCAESGQYAVVHWIDATTEASTHAGLVALATELEVEPGADLAATSAVIDGALARLDRRWLLVLDNADTLDHLVGNLPTASGGMALVTTRSTTAGAEVDAVVVDVDVFDPEEAVGFLLAAVSAAGPDPAAASIADRLGYLPLALAQAAAFMNDKSMSLAAYDALIAKDLPRGLAVSATRHERTVATLWNHIWRLLSEEALAVLARASLLAPKAIPVEALETESASAQDVSQALREAARYRVVTITDGPTGLDTVDVHQLTQLAARPTGAELDRAVLDVTLCMAHLASSVDALNPNSWPAWERLDPHVIHFHSTTPSSILTMRVVDRLATYRQWRGLLYDAIPLFEGLLEEARSFPTPDPSRISTARSNLATAYWQAGRVTDAIEIEEGVAADVQDLFGDDSLNSLVTRQNLAVTYTKVGRLDEAIALAEAVVEDSERTLGPSHPFTFKHQVTLAAAYREAGRYADALAIDETGAAACEAAHGRDHPETLAAKSSLFLTYAHMGRTAEAADLGASILRDRERILGPDHPDIVNTKANLATVYRLIGRDAEGKELLDDAVEVARRVLGTDHPDTAMLVTYQRDWV
jgi:tetratricopeptide (TPR) repeat protein